MEEKSQTVSDNSNTGTDDLHTLGLDAFDIKFQTLREARLVKNVFLETVVEFKESELASSGPMPLKQLAIEFDERDVSREEIKMINNLASLPSFDCYTLKRGIGPMKISLLNDQILKLSDERVGTLFDLMSRITRPLIQYLYTDDNLRIKDTSGLLSLIQNTEPLKVKDLSLIHI